jgi:hypothetical protein
MGSILGRLTVYKSAYIHHAVRMTSCSMVAEQDRKGLVNSAAALRVPHSDNAQRSGRGDRTVTCVAAAPSAPEGTRLGLTIAPAGEKLFICDDIPDSPELDHICDRRASGYDTSARKARLAVGADPIFQPTAARRPMALG